MRKVTAVQVAQPTDSRSNQMRQKPSAGKTKHLLPPNAALDAAVEAILA